MLDEGGGRTCEPSLRDFRPFSALGRLSHVFVTTARRYVAAAIKAVLEASVNVLELSA